MFQLSFFSGPQTVAAIHVRCPCLLLDVHVVTATPELLILPLKQAGVSRFTFQFEIARDGEINRRKRERKLINNDDVESSDVGDERDERDKRDERNESHDESDEVTNGSGSETDNSPQYEDVVERGVVGMARSVRRAGMLCGVCVSPQTPVTDLTDLLGMQYCTRTGAVRSGGTL